MTFGKVRLSRGWDDILPYSTTNGQGVAGLALAQYGTTGMHLYKWTDSAAADDTYQFGFQMPHRMSEGSDVHFHLHVIPSANGAGGNEVVRLKFDYQWVNIDAAFSTTTNTTIAAASYTVGATDGDKHKLWEPAALSGSGKTYSSGLIMRVTRLGKTDAADNYTGDIWLLFADLHIEINGLGSISETVVI
jgi:hypothetical protein